MMARFEARGAVGSLYASFAPTGDPPSQSSGTLMSLQEGIAEPCAWYAIRFLRLCRGWTGTLYTSFAPTGDPPSQSSGTLMSLQEGIAEPRAHGCDEPFHRKSAGRRPDVPTEPPRHPNTYLSPLGELSAVPNPSIPPPRSRTVFPIRAARGSHP